MGVAMSIETRNNQPDEQALFEAVEGVRLDPFLSEVLEKMRVFNDLLSAEPQNETEINEIMSEVDTEWKNLIQEPVSFTGIAWFLDERNLNREELVRSYYEEHEMRFLGVIPHEVGRDFSQEDARYYELRVLVEREAIDGEGRVVGLRGTIRIDDIAALEFSGLMSVSRARKILELYAPQMISDIDIAMLNEADDETELLKRLENIITDEHQFADFDDAAFSQLMIALNIYTNSLLTYDTGAPYKVRLDGDIWFAQNATTVLPALIPDTLELARIARVVWERMHEDGPRTIRPMLDLYILASEKDDAETHVYAPFSTIKQLASLRHEFYSMEDRNVHDDET